MLLKLAIIQQFLFVGSTKLLFIYTLMLNAKQYATQ